MKKCIAILLSLCLLFSCFALTASAAAPGDVDGDGKVTSADARLALRASVNLEKLDKAALDAADVDRDGKVTSADARIILRISVNLDAIVDGKIVPAGSVKKNAALRIGTANLSGNFSPFFSESGYDQDVWAMTAVSLLNNDRSGILVDKSISPQPVSYNGTDYTYPGISDLTITENADGSVWYDFTLREGVTFADGKPLTADDVIFTMYVLSDPTYDGTSTFFSLPIEGMAAYRTGMDTLANLIYHAGKNNTDFTFFTKEQQTGFWTGYDAAVAALVRDIVDYCVANGHAEDAAGAAETWGYGGAADEEAFAEMLSDAYGANLAQMFSYEAAAISLEDVFPDFGDYSGTGIKTGDSADAITGIRKTGAYSLRVVLTHVSAPAVDLLNVSVAPLHYYGDAAQYDYENHRFGFPKGDLSSVRAKTGQPMGAGPYKFEEYKDGVVTLTANENYYLGAAKIRTVQFVENRQSVEDVLRGAVDIVEPAFNVGASNVITGANGNGKLTGDKLVTSTVDNMGYGYLGINANSVSVGGEPGSDASKSLRKALATVLAVYREKAVADYYGEAAVVIEYPISNTSWAAPQKTDEGYKTAFSEDVNGKAIYTDGMTQAEKEAAALQAALGWFKAAGYTVENGRVTAAPAGARLAYEVMVPGDGRGDHPACKMLKAASAALASVGVTLKISDLTNSAEMWNAIGEGRTDMWCAAWGATADPDMDQIYYSGVETGGEPGGSNYMYDIADAELDRLILAARASADRTYRKGVYKKCLDIIGDWAVELPLYQRQNAVVFSAERIKASTITPDITNYYGWEKGITQMELA